jgi:hypothetical protein
MKNARLTFVKTKINLCFKKIRIFVKDQNEKLLEAKKIVNNSKLRTAVPKGIVTLGLLVASSIGLSAQFDVGMDLYSRYLWRGLELSSSPSFQPWLSYTTTLDSKNGVELEVGAWGAYSFNGSSSGDGSEADIYATISYDKFSFTVTDYFFPTDLAEQDYFQDGHSFELMASYEGPISLSAAYDLSNEAFYAEAGVTIAEGASLFVGVGNEYYTTDTEFNVMNFGLNYSKEIKISDSFSLPVTGVILWNPEADKIHMAVGISF